MERQPIESEALRSVGYDPAQRVLEAEFPGGAVYRYYNVPLQAYVALLQADSFGQHFLEHVRNAGYRFRRVH